MFIRFIKKKRRLFLFSLNILFIIVLISVVSHSVSCSIFNSFGNGESTHDPTKLTLSDSKLIVGTDPTYPPFEFMEEEKIIGFDIDIATEIADKLEKELDLVTITWDSTFEIPDDLEVDMIISAIPIMEGKEDLVDFSDPYYVMEYMLISLNEAQIKIKEDLLGKKIGILEVAQNDLSVDYLADYTIETFDDVFIMLEELGNKDIEGILLSLPIGIEILRVNEGIYVVLDVISSEKEFGIVFRKEHILKLEVDRILEELHDDGTFDTIYNKWFGYDS